MNPTTEKEPVPLVVDLDGTLLKSDLLYEGLLGLISRTPLTILRLPQWLFLGRAGFKTKLAECVDVDVSLLPYCAEVVA
ncbi:MAG: prenyltransferase, partial [Proteobacteria bacterium]|nr:prenyltransferase [Pseudomonadota bacterium]